MSQDIVPVPALEQPGEFPTTADRAAGVYNSKAIGWAGRLAAFGNSILDIAHSAFLNASHAKSSAQAAQAALGSATVQADAAMAYRNTASLHAGAAANAAGSAVSSADAASTALASMQSLYLGAKTAVPTTNNAGGALVVGCWYTYIGSDPALKGWHWWDGAAWQLGVGDVGSAFVSKAATVYDGSTAMHAAPVQTCCIFAAAAGAHGADWPAAAAGAAAAVAWVVDTKGDATRAVQTATKVGPVADVLVRSKDGGSYSAWQRVMTTKTFVENAIDVYAVGGAGVSKTLNPADSSMQMVRLSQGSMRLDLVPPRWRGDQITVTVWFSGGAWPLTFGPNIRLPKGVPIPAYSSNDILTIVFVSIFSDSWECFFSGVHQ